MTPPIDMKAYLAAFDDIPGTRVFTAKRARAGYHLNQFAMSLMKAENRDSFKADERAYLVTGNACERSIIVLRSATVLLC